MRLTSLTAAGYRSLKSIRLDLGQVGLFVGENGVGKSNLYRALQLIKAAAKGTLANEIAREGGMQSALWSGARRVGQPARVILRADFEDDETAVKSSYRSRLACRRRPRPGLLSSRISRRKHLPSRRAGGRST